MDDRRLGTGAIEKLVPLAGGTQNILLRFCRGGREYVLRRAPAHSGNRGSTTMRREARLLSALAGSNVSHPRFIAMCEDSTVLGGEFYLMDWVAGFNLTVGMPAAQAASSSKRHLMGLSFVDGIATLADVDYRAIGLEGFGRPEGYLDRQVARWQTQLEGYGQYPNWDGYQDLDGLAQISGWLEHNRPHASPPGIVHGDYQLSNVLFGNETSEVQAILDWELSTIGDPLLDLGHVLATWPDEHGDRPGSSQPIVPWGGFPTAHELISRYTLRTSRDLSNISWYAVLACYRMAIILEGSHARASAGLVSSSVGDRLHSVSIRLVARATDMVGGL
jgi:aminoglycoside phosphotransferase (APT) family kinase protein